MYSFYLPEKNPDNLTDPVGGAAGATGLSGYLGELFTHVTAPPSGVNGVYQYRKIFVKNDNATESTTTRAWLDAVEHSGQISIGTSANNTGEIADATTEPPSITWSTPSNYSDGISLGDLSPGEYKNLWIRQYLANVEQSDNYATFRVNIGGLVQ